MSTVIILDNLRSAHNVGAIFRTADGAGVEKLYLCGYTPAPVDRFGRRVPEIEKTSLGASQTVPWEAADDIFAVIGRLQDERYTVVAVEQAPQAIPLYDFSPPERVAYIFGSEVEGIAPDVFWQCDAVIEIPMRGAKESLNVSVAAGIVLFHR